MRPDLFQKVVDEVVAELPPDLLKAIGAVQVVVQEAPSKDQLERSGMAPGADLYGLFDGVALPDKQGDWDRTFPDRVILYRRPLEEDFPDPRDLRREIRTTLIHELGHFFGMDEDDLRERGYA
jgi:predicted Zn-dependent protease with MMP-like domain